MRRLAGALAVLALVAAAYLLGRQHAPPGEAPPTIDAPDAGEPLDPAPGPGPATADDPTTPVGAPFQGLVVDPDGAPVPGATVIMAGAHLHPQQQVEADALGRFRLPEPVRGRVDLWVYAPGLSAPVQEGVAFSDDPDDKVRVILAEAPDARGKVQEIATGKRISGALVRLLQTWPGVVSRQVRSKPDGTFDLGPVAPGEYAVYVEAEGYTRLRGPQLEVGDSELLFELSPGAMLEVTVRNQAGETVAGATVQVGEARGETDASGKALLRGLPAGRARASARHAGHGRGRSKTVTLTDRVVSQGVIVLRPGKLVRGTVIDEGGAPIAHAKVTQEVEGASMVVTDDQGRFELEADSEGAVDLVVSKKGYLRTVTSVGSVAADKLLITLTRPYKPIEGWVLSPAGGELPGAQVKLVAKGGSAAARSGANGRFEFHPGFDGPYTVRATHSEYAASSRADVDANGQVTVKVREPSELLFEVVEADNLDPLANAQVALVGAERREGRSDGMGRVRFGRLPAGRYRVAVSAPWRIPINRRIEAAAGPANVAVRLDLAPAGRLDVRVQASDTGEDLDGAWVKAGPAKVRSRAGAALLEGIPVGDVSLSVTAKGFKKWRRTVPVLERDTGQEEVFLERRR